MAKLVFLDDTEKGHLVNEKPKRNKRGLVRS